MRTLTPWEKEQQLFLRRIQDDRLMKVLLFLSSQDPKTMRHIGNLKHNPFANSSDQYDEKIGNLTAEEGCILYVSKEQQNINVIHTTDPTGIMSTILCDQHYIERIQKLCRMSPRMEPGENKYIYYK